MNNDSQDLVYSEKYDAYYNEKTNEWVEDKCTDPTCKYCIDRPTTPFEPLTGVNK